MPLGFSTWKVCHHFFREGNKIVKPLALLISADLLLIIQSDIYKPNITFDAKFTNALPGHFFNFVKINPTFDYLLPKKHL